MKSTIFKFFIVFLLIAGFAEAQIGVDKSLRRIGFHTGNRAAISFYNDGQIAGFNIGTDIRGEWPRGSGENYIGDLIPLIGVEFVNVNNDTLRSVTISRGPRNRNLEEKHPVEGYFWGWNAMTGFLNPNEQSVAMSHLPNTYPLGGWADPGEFPEVKNYVDDKGQTEWWGYFGRGIKNATQESFFIAFDQSDDEFNGLDANGYATLFIPDSTNALRHGMGLQLRQRGFQWASFLAEDVIFWLYDIKNEGTTTYRKADFGTVVGTLAGGDGDSGDDLGFFDANDWITYSWDSDNSGNRGQEVGYVGYAFLESPGNPYDGIDNDNDSRTLSSPRFVSTDFDSVVYNAGDKIVLIDPTTYERTTHVLGNTTETVSSMGKLFTITPGVTKFIEGEATINTQSGSSNQIFIPAPSALDGYDNDLDGLIDENYVVHWRARVINDQGQVVGTQGVAYKDYINNLGLGDLLIDEKRDNAIDEDGDWGILYDDLGVDGKGPGDDGYPGPDFGEGDGVPTQGEPNFGRTDPDESDQIGLTGFNFFNQSLSPDMTNDSLLWARMIPGRFDVVPSRPQDGDFIYSSGYFPLLAANTASGITGIERFSVSLLFGEDYNDILGNKLIVQQIYNAGYKFPQPPPKPTVSASQEDGKVVLYWDGERSENSRDFITKKNDFQGYKIFRASDFGFNDARSITNAVGNLSFDKPIAEFDKDDDISGFFYPSKELLSSVKGTTFYLGGNTGLVNKWVDTTAIKGQTYFYAVCAYDSGDDSLDIFPEINDRLIDYRNGQYITDINSIVITPGYRPVGYTPASNMEFTKSDGFRATGSVYVEVIDDAAVEDGYSYRMEFADTSLTNLTSSWSLLDLQRPDTVYVPLVNETYVLNPLETLTLPAGSDTILVNGLKIKSNGLTYTASYDTLVNNSTNFTENTPIYDGFRMQIVNDWTVKLDTAIFDNTLEEPSVNFLVFFAGNTPALLKAKNGVGIPNDYQIEFFDSIVDTSVADTLYPPIPTNIFPAKEVKFKVKNLTTDKYVDFVYVRTGTVSTVHSIWIKEGVQGQYKRTWRFNISYTTPNKDLETQGTLTAKTLKPFSRYDNLTFEMQGASINKAKAGDGLKDIKVVPNPYVVASATEAGLIRPFQQSGRGEREIRFTKIPPGSKISIFTVRGELIKTLYHDDLYVGDVFWNLRTEENLDVAFGVYVYVVEAPGIGTKSGKFSLIK